jgi:hypothetical protein
METCSYINGAGHSPDTPRTPRIFRHSTLFTIEQRNCPRLSECSGRALGKLRTPLLYVVIGDSSLQQPMQSVPITTKVASSNHDHGEAQYNIM